jgi:hypothetical protein
MNKEAGRDAQHGSKAALAPAAQGFAQNNAMSAPGVKIRMSDAAVKAIRTSMPGKEIMRRFQIVVLSERSLWNGSLR